MTPGVEYLGGQEGLDLIVGVVHAVEPLAHHVGLQRGLLGQLSAELPHGKLHIIGQGSQIVPGNVGVGHPTPLNGLFVQVRAVVGPHIHLGAQRIQVGPGYAGNGESAPGAAGHVGADLWNLSVDPNLKVFYGEAVLARRDLCSPLKGVVHPVKAGTAWGRRFSGLVGGLRGRLLLRLFRLLFLVSRHYFPRRGYPQWFPAPASARAGSSRVWRCMWGVPTV